MTLHAASRESLESAESRLGEVVGEANVEPAVVGRELLSVVDLLTKEIGLRRAVSDGSASIEARRQLVHSLLADKLAEPTLAVLDVVVTNRWSSPIELLDGLEALGQSALLTSAENAGNLDLVEGQLFRIARIVAAQSDLERALSDQAAPTEAKRTLVREVFAAKVDPVTEALVEQVILRQRGRGVGFGLDRLVELVAARRERSVAHVTSASELSEQQRDTLTQRLSGIYQRPMALHVEVDPRLGGGLIVRVGDEVIDGSAAGRIAALRSQLAS